MTINLQGYTEIIKDTIYFRPAESASINSSKLINQIQSAPHLVLTALSRARKPTQREIIDYIVQCAKGQRDELKPLLSFASPTNLLAIASRDPQAIEDLKGHIPLPENSSSDNQYLFVNNHLVTKESLDKLFATKDSDPQAISTFANQHSGVSWRLEARFADWDCLDIKDFEPLLKARVYLSDPLRVSGSILAVDYREIEGQVRAICSSFKDTGYELLEDRTQKQIYDAAGRAWALFLGVEIGKKMGTEILAKMGLKTESPAEPFSGRTDLN